MFTLRDGEKKRKIALAKQKKEEDKWGPSDLCKKTKQNVSFHMGKDEIIEELKADDVLEDEVRSEEIDSIHASDKEFMVPDCETDESEFAEDNHFDVSDFCTYYKREKNDKDGEFVCYDQSNVGEVDMSKMDIVYLEHIDKKEAVFKYQISGCDGKLSVRFKWKKYEHNEIAKFDSYAYVFLHKLGNLFRDTSDYLRIDLSLYVY